MNQKDIMTKIVQFNKKKPKKLIAWFTYQAKPLGKYRTFFMKLFKDILTPEDFDGMSDRAFFEFRSGLLQKMKKDKDFESWVGQEINKVQASKSNPLTYGFKTNKMCPEEKEVRMKLFEQSKKQGDIDEEMIPFLDSINMIPIFMTTQCCCGHGDDPKQGGRRAHIDFRSSLTIEETVNNVLRGIEETVGANVQLAMEEDRCRYIIWLDNETWEDDLHKVVSIMLNAYRRKTKTPIQNIIQNLKAPRTMWIEDANGNLVENETEIMKTEIPPCIDCFEDGCNPKRFANFRMTVVKHDIFGDKTKDNTSGLLMSGESTVGVMGKSIAKLVNEYEWNLNDACVLMSILCEGCMNTIGSFLEGYKYNETPNTSCDYCTLIRPQLQAGVDRPLTIDEEKTGNSDVIAKAGLLVYSESLRSVNTIIPKNRVIRKENVTGIYRVKGA